MKVFFFPKCDYVIFNLLIEGVATYAAAVLFRMSEENVDTAREIKALSQRSTYI